MLHNKEESLLKMAELHEIKEKNRDQGILAEMTIISTG
jgi:hypothetical protein